MIIPLLRIYLTPTILLPEIDLLSNQDPLSPCEGAELEGLADEVAAEAWFWSYMALKAAKWSR